MKTFERNPDESISERFITVSKVVLISSKSSGKGIPDPSKKVRSKSETENAGHPRACEISSKTRAGGSIISKNGEREEKSDILAEYTWARRASDPPWSDLTALKKNTVS